MAYIDKMIVEGITYDVGALESLKDTNGRNRFLEGSIVYTASDTNLTLTYGKWSLSGSHLMFVMAGTYTSGLSIADSTPMFKAENLPNWVLNKIYPMIGNLIEYKSIYIVNNDWTRGSLEFFISKVDNVMRIYNNGTISLSKNGTFRIQFDLLIDTD